MLNFFVVNAIVQPNPQERCRAAVDQSQLVFLIGIEADFAHRIEDCGMAAEMSCHIANIGSSLKEVICCESIGKENKDSCCVHGCAHVVSVFFEPAQIQSALGQNGSPNGLTFGMRY